MNKTHIRVKNWNPYEKYLTHFNFQIMEILTGTPMTIKQRHITRDIVFGDIQLHLWRIDELNKDISFLLWNNS